MSVDQSPRIADVDIDVPFFDVDSMNMAWHGHYVKYLELARCRLLDQLGHGYQAMFDAGTAWPVTDLRIRYLRPLRFDQPIRIRATLKYWTRQLRIAYRIRHGQTGASLARAATTQSPIDLASGELLAERPAAVGAALAAAGLGDP